MQTRSANAVLAALLFAATLAVPVTANAFDLNGAWASDVDNCAKVFERKGSQVAFAETSDVYGGGFIIEGDQIIGKSGRCKIKARKEDGKTIHLVAACATDIMFQNMQFSLKELDANSVLRLFPGMEGLELKYGRCPAP
jgi:hypothetical protein